MLANWLVLGLSIGVVAGMRLLLLYLGQAKVNFPVGTSKRAG